MRVKKSVSKNTINYAIIKDIKVGNKELQPLSKISAIMKLFNSYIPKWNLWNGQNCRLKS
jgi:hypothetical protein